MIKKVEIGQIFLFTSSLRYIFYIILYLFMKYRKKFGYKVGVDRTLHQTMTKYFVIPTPLPVLEDTYCQEDLVNMKENMVQYSNSENTLIKNNFDQLNKRNVVIDIWPEASKTYDNMFWVPEELLENHSNFIRDQLHYKAEYVSYVQNLLQQISNTRVTDKTPLFIGLHVRRGDYVEFSKKKLKKVSGKVVERERD